MKNESEKLKNSLEVSKLESKRNDEDIQSLKNKLNEKTNELEKIEEQNSWNKERAVSLEDELKIAREKLNKEREYITELKVNKASLDEALTGKLSEISRKEKDIRGNKLSLDSRITSMEGFIGIASDIIKYDDKYTKAINNVLGRTIVCSDMDSALRLSRNSNNSYRIVTLSGELISPGGALTGGSIQGKHTNILGRKREIEEIGELLESKKQKLQEALNEYNSFKKKVSDLDESILNDRDEIHAKNVEVAKNESEIISLKNESEKLKNSLEVSKLESKRNDEDIQSLKNKLNEKTSELEKIDENISKAKFMEDENKDNRENVQILNNNIHERLDRIEIEKNRLVELEESFKEEELEKAKLKEDFKIKDSLINETLDIINKEEGELNKQEVQRAKYEMEKDNHYTKLNEELDLTLAEAQEIAVNIENVHDIKESINSYKRKITALGTVNLAAIEEYDEVKEKYEFMSSQEEDLQKSKEELLSVIYEMTTKMKEL